MALQEYKRTNDEKRLVQDTNLEVTDVFYPPHFEDAEDANVGESDDLKVGAVATTIVEGKVILLVYQGGGSWEQAGGTDENALPMSGGTMTGKLTFAAGTSVSEMFNVPKGVLTTTPKDGALERDASGNLYMTNGSSRYLVTPTPTTFTGQVIALNNIAGAYQISTPNNSSNYTLTNQVLGGWVCILVNTTNKPTVTGSTEILDSLWVSNTDCYLFIKSYGSYSQHYFKSKL